MDLQRLLFVAALVSLCACGGGGGVNTATSGLNAIPDSLASVRTVELGLQPTSVTLPVVSQIMARVDFPAVQAPATITLRATASAPAGVALQHVRRQTESASLIVYEYITLETPTTITLPDLQAMLLTFPASSPLDGKSFYYGISDLDSRGGEVSFNTYGPGTVSGQNVYFAQVPAPITYLAGHKYTVAVYANAEATSGEKLYVISSHHVITYHAGDGTRTAPTINAGGTGSISVAVDTAGKIYIANSATNTVVTYNSDGYRTAPTITAGLNNPGGIAVDSKGTIHVVNAADVLGSSGFTGNVTTYAPDGKQIAPTITAGLSGPVALAVDRSGKMYVCNTNSTVTTYEANGTPAKVINTEDGYNIAVDTRGKIYVVGINGEATYTPDGAPTTPYGLRYPGKQLNYGQIAVDTAGQIFAESTADGVTGIYTFSADGTRTTPTVVLSDKSATLAAVH